MEYLYECPTNLRHYQARLLETLKTIKKICDDNHLIYFLFYGTLLGAVRHNGFIPWDDDVDVVMPRKDFDWLMLHAAEVIKGPYFLQTQESDVKCFYGGYAKLYDQNTIDAEKVWIDILPLDYLCRDAQKQYNKINRVQKLLFAKTYGEYTGQYRDIGEEEWTALRKEGKLYSRNYLCKELHKLMVDKNGEETKYCAVLARYYPNFRNMVIFEDDMFAGEEEHYFENELFRIPTRFDACLERMYGKNYMDPPSVLKRVPKHILRKPHSYKGGFSECTYQKESGYIKIRGWFIPKVKKVEIWDEKGKLCEANIGIMREDVWRNYPEYNIKDSGWQYEGNVKKGLFKIYLKIIFEDGDENIVTGRL